MFSSHSMLRLIPKAKAVFSMPAVRHFNPPVQSMSVDHENDSSIFPVHKRNYYKSYFENGHAPEVDDVKIELVEQ